MTQREATGTPSRLKSLIENLSASFSVIPGTWTSVLLGVGLFARIWYASGTFLNSDEVQHFSAANHASWWETFRASLALSHPPLLIIVLHVWRALGTSELMLRLPSILAGTAFCWFSFRWLSLLFQKTVAWAGFVLLLFLPTSVELSGEIRQYALLLAFGMASAYFAEMALQSNSALRMLLSGLCLALAIASHFSGFLLAAALGIYTIWRMWSGRASLRLIVGWEAGEVVALGVSYFLYTTQISQFGHFYGGARITQGWMSNTYLSHSYFSPGRVNPFWFILGRTVGVFQYAFHQPAIGDLAFVLFVAGMIWVFRRQPASGFVSRQQLGLLLLLPFALNCAAALARLYPYGGTRHCSFLLPFAIAGCAVGLVWLLGNRLLPALAASLVLILASYLFTTRQVAYRAREAQRKANMDSAVAFIRREVLPREPIFADAQTSLLLGHYLCDQHPLMLDRSVTGFVSYECSGRRVIASRTKYIFTARSFYDQWQDMVANYRLERGSKVWVAQMGWGENVASELASFPQLGLRPHGFGSEIQLFDFEVGQAMPDRSLLPAS